MAAIPHEFAKFIDSLATGLVNPHTDDFSVMLLNSLTIGSLVTTAQFVADVLAHGVQSSGSGYTPGGQLLTTKTWSQSGGVWTLNFDDPEWNPSTLAPAWALFFCSTPGSDATNPVVALWDLNGASGSSADSYKLTLDAAGLYFYTAQV